jgi:hypothetical protein
VAVAGDFSAVVKIVEHAELQREFVLVGRDVGAVHGERGIAVADVRIARFQIAENLVVGAVFFDDVNDVLDGILAAGEGDRSRIAVQQVVALNDLRELRKFFESRRNVQAGDRSLEQRGDVGMIFVLGLIDRLAHIFVGARAFAFGGGDEQIVAVNGERTGIPVGGNETEAACEISTFELAICWERSKTATASNEESATNRYLPSEDWASDEGKLPSYFCVGAVVEKKREGCRMPSDSGRQI